MASAALPRRVPLERFLHHFLRSLRRDADIPPAGVLAQAEDIVQGYMKTGGIPDQDSRRNPRRIPLLIIVFNIHEHHSLSRGNTFVKNFGPAPSSK